MEIIYKNGDATQPAGYNCIIAHVCNDSGGWGKGFVMALSRRWPEPEEEYRNDNGRLLGDIQLVRVEHDIVVCNMIAQRRYSKPGRPAISYEHLATCLERLAEECECYGFSVHMPRIGCGLGGGSWDKVEPIINSKLIERGIQVTVYDLPSMRRA